MSSEALSACRSGHLKNGAIVVSALLQSEDTSAALCLVLKRFILQDHKGRLHHDAHAAAAYLHHWWRALFIYQMCLFLPFSKLHPTQVMIQKKLLFISQFNKKKKFLLYFYTDN